MYNIKQDQKTYEQFCHDVSIKHGLGKSLVTGHKASYFLEAAELYAQQFKDELAAKQKEIEELKEWKRQQIEVSKKWDQVHEFAGQSDYFKIGENVSDTVLRGLKELDKYKALSESQGNLIAAIDLRYDITGIKHQKNLIRSDALILERWEELKNLTI